MNNEVILRSILAKQELIQSQKKQIMDLHGTIKNFIEQVIGGDPHVWYGGSYRKGTMIQANYDLDVVVLWKSYFRPSLEKLYDMVGNALQHYWPQKIEPKRVCWRIYFDDGLNVDIVPGRYAKTNGKFAYLFDNHTKRFLLTSIEIHNDYVQRSGFQDVIRLLKLWKISKNVPIRTFILELMVIEGCSGLSNARLDPLLRTALNFIARNILSIELRDPANKRNIITKDLTYDNRRRIQELSWNADRETDISKIFV